MNIAILHYHLNRGGVTRVIANQLLALDSVLSKQQPCCAAILYDGQSEGWPEDLAAGLKHISLHFCRIPLLEYESQPSVDAEPLAVKIRQQLAGLEFSPHNTLLHVHNHSLGKNASLPAALNALTADGYALLLQIHDFAEDFRPLNYRFLCEAPGHESLGKLLYPQSPNVHYTTLNRRDHAVLLEAGIAKERLHFLPNPVPRLGNSANRTEARSKLKQRFGIPEDHAYLLYPVRGIRRKNLGELLLWSILTDDQTEIAITLQPMNSIEILHYRYWKQLAAALELRCHFETGEQGGLAFEENLAAADAILTTSVAEGFGMVFLESWLAERLLLGRNLPEITADFVDVGIRYNSLYDRLNVPIDWVGKDEYLLAFQSAYEEVLKTYHQKSLDREEFDRVLETKIQSSCIDFADLNETLQEKIIRLVRDNSQRRDELLELNPLVSRPVEADEENIRNNKQLIEQTYSSTPSGERLMNLYHTVLSGCPVTSTINEAPIDGNRILNSFLDPARYRPIRG